MGQDHEFDWNFSPWWPQWKLRVPIFFKIRSVVSDNSVSQSASGVFIWTTNNTFIYCLEDAHLQAWFKRSEPWESQVCYDIDKV